MAAIKVVVGQRPIKAPRKDMVTYHDTLQKELKLNEEVTGISYRTVGTWAGLNTSRSVDFKLAAEKLGLIRTRIAGSRTGATGKVAFWTLLVTPDQGLEIINKASSADGYIRMELPITKYESEAKKDDNELLPKGAGTLSTVERIPGVVLAKRDTEETRAIAGPEPVNPLASLAPLRRDEPGALIAAARQYQQRATAVKETLTSLAKLGVTVDEGAIHFQADPVLDVVVEILPTIRSLESEADRWKNAYNDLKTKTSNYDEMRRNYEALKRRQNTEMTARVSPSLES